MLIDLSGYSFSGKSALYDILDSLENVGGFGFESEFELLRAHGGIYELIVAVSTNPWSPVRSDAAVREFQVLAWNLGGSRSVLKDRMFRLGTYYDDLFPGYSDAVDRLLKTLVGASWKGHWPFRMFLAHPWKTFINKLCFKMGFSSQGDIYLSRVDTDYAYEMCRLFLTCLIDSARRSLNVDYVLLNNTFEPSSNDALYSIVGECVPVVVDRDPRDIYISAWLRSADGVGSAVLGGCVDDFIKRFLTYREATNTQGKAIYIMFDDMVTDFDYLSNKLSVLGLPRQDLFNSWEKVTAASSMNMGLWRRPLPKHIEDDVSRIEDRLSHYCRSRN